MYFKFYFIYTDMSQTHDKYFRINKTDEWQNCKLSDFSNIVGTGNEHIYQQGRFRLACTATQSCQNSWTASSNFGTYRLCEQRRFRRACASAQSRQNLRRSLIQAMSQEEPSDRKPDPWPLWMAGHTQLKFVMTECSKTQIRLTQSI